MHIQDLNPHETERAARLLISLNKWLENLPPEGIKNETYNAALDSVNNAILETRKYQKHRREGENRSPETENLLSTLWNNAASQIRPYDANLSDLCLVKGHGWADETVWNDPQHKDLPIRVDQMLDRLRGLAKSSPPRPTHLPLKRFHDSAPLASWIFGGLILIFLMVVVFVDISPSKFPIIRFFMALSAAFFAFFFVGGVLLEGTLRGLFISATGGFVLFILIQFVFNPFEVLPTPTTTTTSITQSTPTPATPTPATPPISPNALRGSRNTDAPLPDERARRLKKDAEQLMNLGKYQEAIDKLNQALGISGISKGMESELKDLRIEAVTMASNKKNAP